LLATRQQDAENAGTIKALLEEKMIHRKSLIQMFSILCLIALLAGCTAVPTQAPASSAAPAEEAAASDEPVTLTFLVDEAEANVASVNAYVAAYTALHPNVTIEVEVRPGGTEGDNIVKTRLATGEMTDIFWYNTGSLLQALQPADTLVDLSQEPFIANIVESFLPTVSHGDGIYGVPGQTAMGGGILYNRKVYEDLGLSVPTTWEEFAANNEAILAAGIAPVIATFGDTWTSQLFVLADYYNVETAVPGFAEAYTANQAKYATTPAAMAGFEYLAEGFEKGWYQQDFATTRFEQGLQLLAEGAGAHYPMLTFALSTIATQTPDLVENIGFFAQPGTDAAANGVTIWMPAGVYIPKTTSNLEVAKDFLAFIASVEGANALSAAVEPTGPYMIKGVELPDTVLTAVKEIAAYIDAGKSGPALEFLSPIKGPSLEQITVAVGTGQMTPEDAAVAYDEDVENQAQQLGLEGW
jgi:raffinose/stachyose/melibiose transport system substrate-binding protein